MTVKRLLLLTLVLASQVTAAPKEATRVVHTFDFEERRLGNAEDLPMDWVKVEGVGFPHYVNGRLSDDRAHSGSYSFKFDLNGGGLVYRYPHGHIPVQLGAHYHVDSFVQTTALTHARARMTAYFTDADGHPLIDSIHHTEPFVSNANSADWKQLGLDLSTDDVKAAWLVIELELLQPSQ